MKSCRRIIYDSSIDDSENFIPQDECFLPALRDLAYARLLPLRQRLGQFLSSYSPRDLSLGLQRIMCLYRPEFYGEARHMVDWQQEHLRECAQVSDVDYAPSIEMVVTQSDSAILEMQWFYKDEASSFSWVLSENGVGRLCWRWVGASLREQAINVQLLVPEKALEESLFF